MNDPLRSLLLPLAVLAAVLLCVPVVVFVTRQKQSGSFLLGVLLGAGIPPGGTILAGMAFMQSGADIGYGLVVLTIAAVGAVVGAYLGLAIAACSVGPDEQRRGAQRGAGYGLLAGVILAVLIVALAPQVGQFWFRDHWSRPLGSGFCIVALLSSAGAMIGRGRPSH